MQHWWWNLTESTFRPWRLDVQCRSTFALRGVLGRWRKYEQKACWNHSYWFHFSVFVVAAPHDLCISILHEALCVQNIHCTHATLMWITEVTQWGGVLGTVEEVWIASLLEVCILSFTSRVFVVVQSAARQLQMLSVLTTQYGCQNSYFDFLYTFNRPQ